MEHAITRYITSHKYLSHPSLFYASYLGVNIRVVEYNRRSMSLYYASVAAAKYLKAARTHSKQHP